MCCSSKKSSVRGTKSGKITRTRKTPKKLTAQNKNEQSNENRERLLLFYNGKRKD